MVIQILALDIDGVMTDGTTSLAQGEFDDKRLNFSDLDAISRVQQIGLQVALITGEVNSFVDRLAQRLNIQLVRQGAKDKLSTLTELANIIKVPLESFCYVGDSDRDANALAAVGLGLAPANASLAAQRSAKRVLTRSGGAGAVAEAVTLVEHLQNDTTNGQSLENVIKQILNESISAHQRMLEESRPVLVQISQCLTRTIRSGNKILLFGNGGSAADAQHVAAELVGRFFRNREPWPAMALTTNTSALTAIGNDWEFSEIFSRQVRAFARPGDVVVGISTSGKSPNVLQGLKVGRDCGAIPIGFTGEKVGIMRPFCDLLFLAPSSSTPRIQELHILAWHIICELVESSLAETMPLKEK